MKDIEGIDILLSKLPERCHRWDTFNFIDEFKYQTVFDDTDKYDYINNIEMVIRDEQKKYWLKMLLTDVSGRISFDTLNAFFTGLLLMTMVRVRSAATSSAAVKWILTCIFTAQRYLWNYFTHNNCQTPFFPT